jgi:predicted AlkP superfamily phosphohydrolase/phosphomutase
MRVVLIGLDGMPWSLIMPYLDELPTFRKLLEEGVSGTLKSTFPPLTCPAWFSFSTGKKPEKLGIYNFYMIKKASYDIKMVDNSIMTKENEIWDLLNKHKIQSFVINNPIGYPPKKINGVWVSGFLAPSEHSSYTYPEDLKKALNRIAGGYEIDVSQREGQDEAVIEGNQRTMKKRERVFTYFLDEFKEGFFFLVFTEPDRIFHQFVNRLYSKDKLESVKSSKVIEEFLKKLDSYINHILKSINDQDHLIIMSDHGFTKRDKCFFINQWLIKEGYLSLKKENRRLKSKIKINQKLIADLLEKIHLRKFFKQYTPEWIKKVVPRGPIEGEGINIIDLIKNKKINWKNTKAFAIPGGIYLNTKDKPYGIVGKTAETNLKNEILEKLIKFSKDYLGSDNKDFKIPEDIPNNSPYDVPAIHWKEVIGKGYGISINIPPQTDRLTGHLTLAHHSEDGIFLYKSAYSKKGLIIDDAEIIDITPTILFIFDVPIPKDMDGRVLKEIFKESSEFAKREIKYQEIDEKMELKEKIRRLKARGRI